MGKAKTGKPAKLIVGFIFKEKTALRAAESILEKRFSKIDFASPVLAFKHTPYYQKEFGSQLLRKFISFSKPIDPQKLADIKRATNIIEKKLSRAGKRRINIDPGYLELGKLVLATTKDYKHRIYLSKGIFAEVTLYFQEGTFRPWEWTYPDYKSEEYLEIFNNIREIYAKQLNPGDGSP